MSAAEVIEQIKKLPPEDVVVVREFLRERSESEVNSVAYISRDEVKKSAEKMFDRYGELFKKLAQ